MKLQIKTYNYLCELEIFSINGINASYNDFGETKDIAPIEDYCCGNMQFIPKLAKQNILDKYNINIDEYNEICTQLKEKLSFGRCCACL